MPSLKNPVRGFLTAIMLVIAFFFFQGAPVSAQTTVVTTTVTIVTAAEGWEINPPAQVFVAVSRLNVRYGPGTDNAVFRVAECGEPLLANFRTRGSYPWFRLEDGTWTAGWLTSSNPAVACGGTAPVARGGTAAPSAAGSSAALKYDEHGCDASNLAACAPAQAAWAAQVGGHEFPAIYLRNVQAGERTPADAIVNIQQMAAAVGAQSWDGWQEFRADTVSPTLLWCAGGFSGWFPDDTAFPLGVAVGGTAQIVIMSSHFSAVPPAGQTAFKCLAGDGWAVLLH